jgi:hypothetical protein
MVAKAKKAAPKKPVKKAVKKAAKKSKQKSERISVDRAKWEHMKACKEQAVELEKRRAKLEQYRKQFSAERSAVKELDSELSRMLLDTDDKYPLFQKGKAPEAQAKPQGEQAPATAVKTVKSDDAWRSVKIGTVLADPKFDKQVTKLQESGVETAGQFEDLRAKSHNGNWSDAVKGIGRAKADSIEQAVLDWLTKNQ